MTTRYEDQWSVRTSLPPWFLLDTDHWPLTTALLPQPHPAFRDHQGVTRIMRVVLHRRGQPQAAGMQVDPLAQIGYILRALVGNARDVIFVNEEHGSVMAVADRQFLHIDDSAISDAPDAVEPGTAFTFKLSRPLWLPPQERVCTQSNGASGGYQRIEMKRIHREGVPQRRAAHCGFVISI